MSKHLEKLKGNGMPGDTSRLRQEHELTLCPEPEPCCGITYRLLSTNRGDGAKEQGQVYWTEFVDINNFQILGEPR
jgi:hypothetical protein